MIKTLARWRTTAGRCDACKRMKPAYLLGPDYGCSHRFCAACLDMFELAEAHFDSIADQHGVRLSQETLASLAYRKVG